MEKQKKYIDARRTGEGVSAFCFVSGRQVLDEGLLDGNYVLRFRNCMGQIDPDMHLSRNAPQPAELYSSFIIEINGRILTGNWIIESFSEIEDAGLLQNKAEVWALCLYDDTAKIAVTVLTRLDGSDFIVRRLRIENRGVKAVSLTGVTPYGGIIWSHGTRPEAVGESAAFSVGYNHLKDWGREGDFYFDELNDRINIFSDYGKSGWGRPAAWLRNRCNGETFVFEYAWSGNWEINAVLPDKNRALLCANIGMLRPENECLRVLLAGESVETPAVHFALFRDSDDAIIQHTHSHVREAVLPPLPDGVPLIEIEANHRGYLCDRESEEGIKRDIDVAKAAGCEMYVVDAGWYGSDERNEWYNNTGDWQAGQWMKNGFEPIPQYVHASGMRFGLWVEIEACGGNSELRRRHPEWQAKRNGVLIAGGRALDLANPEVENFCFSELCRLTEQYQLDMYRLDHNHNMGLGANREYEGFTENTLWRYYDAFCRIFRRLREKYPSLVMQNCAGGGGRLDWGTMSLFHNAELSDWLRQPRGIRILNGVTVSLPPEVLLRTYGTESGDMAADGDLATQCRAAMICRPILRGVAPSVERLVPWLKDKLLHQLEIFRSFTRPVMKDCLVWHHTPFQPVMESAGMTILEYAVPERNKALLVIFSGTEDGKTAYTVYPRSVRLGENYKITFDNSGESLVINGYMLKSSGLRISLSQTQCSEYIMLEKI